MSCCRLLLIILTLIKTIVTSSKSPNIVFIVIDDLGWADPGYRSESDFKLKNIGYLHSIGVDLINYYVHRVCTPTRSAFMSGRYAWQNGAQKVFTPQTLQHLPFFNGANTKLLPQYLQQNNYMTFGLGKWHLVSCILSSHLRIHFVHIFIFFTISIRDMQHTI